MMKKGLVIGALLISEILGMAATRCFASTDTFVISDGAHVTITSQTGSLVTTGGYGYWGSAGSGYWISGSQNQVSESFIILSSIMSVPQILTSDGIETVDDFGPTADADISPDGSTLGSYINPSSKIPYVMTSSGLQELPLTATNERTFTTGSIAALATTPSGTAIAGTGSDGSATPLFWATPTSSPVVITSSLDSPDGESGGMSPNGQYVTGQSYSDYSPFLYKTSTNQLVLLPKGIGAIGAEGFGISNDGKTVIGSEADTDNAHAAFWYSNSGFSVEGLTNHVSANYVEGYLHDTVASNSTRTASEFSQATAISANGSTIVGWTNGMQTAVKWNRLSPGNYSAAQNLGSLGGSFSEALAVNADGTVIVGGSTASSGEFYGFRWTMAGMQSIENWLASEGVTNSLAEGVHTVWATGVSADGSVVVGSLSDSNIFIARSTSGLIRLNDLEASLATISTAPRTASAASDIAMHGSHGHPLMRLAEEGHWTTWLSGDFGLSSSRDSGSYADVAELGVGNRINKNIQLSLSVGKMFAGSKTLNNGKTKQELTYILPEIIANVPDSPIWTTFSFQFASGPVDIRRGYMNLGSLDYSAGKPRADIYSVRARADWKDALEYRGIGFTPYLDHQHTEVALASYTETGGGFPAHWNARRQHDDVSRIGLDITKAITKDLNVFATAEQNRWWQGKGAAASGYLVGVSTFNSPSEKYARDWSQFSVGAKHAIGSGKISATANASTNGQNPQYWLAMNYQYDF